MRLQELEVGGIEPPTRIVAQGLTGHCDQIVTVFLGNVKEIKRDRLSFLPVPIKNTGR